MLGLRARRESAGHRMATAAIVIGALALAQMTVYSIASALS